MRILFVLNNFYSAGNGLAASARRTVSALREAGQDVRVLSGPNHVPGGPQPEYLLKDFHFPLFQPIIDAQGYQFALDSRSRFAQRNARELAAKMDWWLEHPQERESMAPRYVEEMEKYAIDHSARELIRMFEDALRATLG